MSTRAWLALGAALALAAGCGSDGVDEARLRATRFGGQPDLPAPRQRYDRALAEACRPEAALADDAALVRRPYLQRTTESGSAVLWTSRRDSAISLDLRRADGTALGTFPARTDATSLLRDATQRSVELSGLLPDTVYCYTLRDAEGAPVARHGLRTAPEPGTGAAVAFVAFGDQGEGGSDQRAVFSRVQSVPFDLVLSTGDVAYPAGSLDSFEHNFFEVYAPMLASFPLFPAVGNHDYMAPDAAAFREVYELPGGADDNPDGIFYSFDWGEVHFVALDTERLSDEQSEWLTADLSANALPWTIVFLHRSPYSSGRHGSALDVRERLAPIFERHHVPLVLAGHDHDYERSKPVRGVTYVVTGGGGRATAAVGSSDFTAFSHDVLHFVYVTVEGDDLRLYAIDATGQEFDFVHLRRSDG